jgi:hypothetical protein
MSDATQSITVIMLTGDELQQVFTKWEEKRRLHPTEFRSLLDNNNLDVAEVGRQAAEYFLELLRSFPTHTDMGTINFDAPAET